MNQAWAPSWRIRLTLAVLLAGWCAPVPATAWALAAEPAPLTGQVRLVLEKALEHRGRDGQPTRTDLVLLLQAAQGRWDPLVLGLSPACNLSLHEGQVVAGPATQPAGPGQVWVRLQINPDAQGNLYGVATAPEGVLEALLEIGGEGDKLAGAYRGAMVETRRGKVRGDARPRQVAGALSGSVSPLPAPAAGHVEIKPGEHPRLFFRGTDLARLRAQAETPQGQRIVAHLRQSLELGLGGFGWHGAGVRCAPPYTEGSWAAGHGFLFLLTGDKAQARRAGDLARLAVRRNDGEWGGWGMALRTAGAAMAYDFCYEAWDGELRQEVQTFLEAAAMGRGRATDLHFDAMFQAAGGLAALAVLGDPQPAQPSPTAPDRARRLPAPKSIPNDAGVPVVALASDRVPGKWLLAAGLTPKPGEDPLASLGGRARARPGPGTKLKTPAGEVAFEAHTADKMLWLFGVEQKCAKAVRERPDRASTVLAYFYTIVDLDRPRTVKALVNPWGSFYPPDRPTAGLAMWLNGQEIRHGDVLALEKGRYPLLVEAPLNHGMAGWPRLVDYGEPQYRAELQEWEQRRAAWLAADKTTPHAAGRLRLLTAHLQAYAQVAVGDLGFPREGSNWTDAWHLLLPFAQAHRNVTGVSLAQGSAAGLRQIIPLQLADEGRHWHCDWGEDFWRTLGFADLVPAAYRPALRWAMDQREDLGARLPSHDVFALLNYPFEEAACEPRGLGLPLTWQDRRLGAFLFRSGWDPQRDFALVVGLQSDAPRSSLTAGDFSLLGRRGRGRWTGMTTAGGGLFRPPCLTEVERPNVIRIDGAIPTRGARLLHSEARPDGSGALSFVLDDWVKGSATKAHDFPRVEDPANLGITHHRHLAVDYSGASGAPALLVVVDQVKGAGERAVLAQLNLTQGKGGPGGTLNFAGSTFTLRPSPRGGEQEAGPMLTGVFLPIHGAGEAPVLGTDGPKKPSGILLARHEAPAASGEHLFVLVLAVHEGPAPKIEATGKAGDFTVTAGGQTVRFDGGKLTLGK